MRAAFLRLLLGVSAVGAVVAAALVVQPVAKAARPPHAGVAPVRSAAVVCPSVTGGSGGGSTDMTVATLGPSKGLRASYSPLLPTKGSAHSLSVNPRAVVHQTTPYAAVSVQASGDGAGELAVTQEALTPTGIHRALTDLACAPANTDWWFAGADGRVGVTDVLVLSNPTDQPANVALSLWSVRGPLNPPGTSGIIVPPHTAQLRQVANLAPDVPGITIHVHANSGSIAAALLDQHTSGIHPVGVDWIPPTVSPAVSSVVTGFVSGAALDWLELTNPGDRDTTVTLRVVTPTRNFQPAGHQSVVVAAGHTVTVDLAGAIAGETAAVVTSSDAPIVSEGMTLLRPTTGFSELAWLAAQVPLHSPAGIAANAPPFGQQSSLVLAAPSGAADVRVSTPGGASANVHVSAGRLAVTDLTSLLHAGPSGVGAILLTPLRGGPVYVVRILHALGAHGPLLTAEAPTVFPLPITLPAVEADLSAGTR
ncbi:MAG TPA: DUF5719 family protein [Mycobacteriales bacterium]|nr:DUF5719 family protein [Mycobacteriales bacterium]